MKLFRGSHLQDVIYGDDGDSGGGYSGGVQGGRGRGGGTEEARGGPEGVRMMTEFHCCDCIEGWGEGQ